MAEMPILMYNFLRTNQVFGENIFMIEQAKKIALNYLSMNKIEIIRVF